MHFENQIRFYDSQLVVNLLDQKGAELELSEAYKGNYHWFL